MSDKSLQGEVPKIRPDLTLEEDLEKLPEVCKSCEYMRLYRIAIQGLLDIERQVTEISEIFKRSYR